MGGQVRDRSCVLPTSSYPHVAARAKGRRRRRRESPVSLRRQRPPPAAQKLTADGRAAAARRAPSSATGAPPAPGWQGASCCSFSMNVLLDASGFHCAQQQQQQQQMHSCLALMCPRAGCLDGKMIPPCCCFQRRQSLVGAVRRNARHPCQVSGSSAALNRGE